MVTNDGNGGLRSCDHRHGVSVKKGVWKGDLRQNATLLWSEREESAVTSATARRSPRNGPESGPIRALYSTVYTLASYRAAFTSVGGWCREACPIEGPRGLDFVSFRDDVWGGVRDF